MDHVDYPTSMVWKVNKTWLFFSHFVKLSETPQRPLPMPAPSTLQKPADKSDPDHVVSRIVRPLFRPIDISLLAVFRITFGLVMLYEIWRFFANGWIRTQFIDPSFHFTYYGFSWVKPWPGNGMYWHFAVLAALAAMVTVGLFYRFAAAGFFLGITYVFLLEQAIYLNHMYLVCVLSFIAVFLPANRKWSLDVKRRPEIRSETAPAWTLWLLRFQVGAVYFFGGIAKMEGDWLSGEPIRLMLSARTSFPLIGQYFGETWMIMLFVWGGLLFDLFVVPLMLWSRTRLPTYIAAVLFHTMNAHLFQIGIFPLFMVAATMLFFPADSLREKKEPDSKPGRNTKKTRKLPVSEPQTPSPVSGPITAGQWGLVAFLMVFVAIQVFLPFRHFLYPGEVNWTEEGHRFAWHMKLRVKGGDGCEYFATDSSGKPADLSEYADTLTEKQSRSMSTRPDMILQYAHFLAERLRESGVNDPVIRVRAPVSLNSRPQQLLIDPDANLAAKKRDLRHADWILPLNIESD